CYHGQFLPCMAFVSVTREEQMGVVETITPSRGLAVPGDRPMGVGNAGPGEAAVTTSTGRRIAGRAWFLECPARGRFPRVHPVGSVSSPSSLPSESRRPTFCGPLRYAPRALLDL